MLRCALSHLGFMQCGVCCSSGRSFVAGLHVEPRCFVGRQRVVALRLVAFVVVANMVALLCRYIAQRYLGVRQRIQVLRVAVLVVFANTSSLFDCTLNRSA